MQWSTKSAHNNTIPSNDTTVSLSILLACTVQLQNLMIQPIVCFILCMSLFKLKSPVLYCRQLKLSFLSLSVATAEC
jgi:hypothetical protein